jgi:hypothetical protein
MKAKHNLPRERTKSKPLAVRIIEQRQEGLSIQEEHIKCLGEARLKTEGVDATAHIDAINWLHHRAASLCTVVEEAAYSASGSEMPPEALAVVMGSIEEDIQVAGWIAGNMFDLLQDPQASQLAARHDASKQ